MASGRPIQIGAGLWIEPPSSSPESEQAAGDDYFGIAPVLHQNTRHLSGLSPTSPDTPVSLFDSNPASADPLLPPGSGRPVLSQQQQHHHHSNPDPDPAKDPARATVTEVLLSSSVDIADARVEYLVTGEALLELGRVRSRRPTPVPLGHHARPGLDLSEEAGSPTRPVLASSSQGVPAELASFAAECLFVVVCSVGQCMFAMSLGSVMVPQTQLRDALGILPTQVPWLLGSSMLASGLSVMVAGSLADLVPPKPLMVVAFWWQAIWNAVAAGSLSPDRRVLFFVARAMNGLALGVVVSASMSILGRVYKPGRRKTRVFSLMAATGPVGFWFGCVQGGALAGRLPFIFGINTGLLVLCAVAAHLSLPPLRPATDSAGTDAPTLRQFDWGGAALSAVGPGLLIFGLTQGSGTHWSTYTCASVAAGVVCLVALPLVERRVARPLIPAGLFRIPGFVALLASFLLGFGGFTGGWQFYAIQFWQRYQGASPLTTALYFLPNGVGGVIATWIVSLTLHRLPTHWIFAASMICFALGPVFFLAQTAETSYYALSMPGVFLSCFGPDMGFAAAAIFITSSVPRSYQGAAGSLLVTVQNLAGAVVTSAAGSVGSRVDTLPTGEVGLAGIRACWWFGFGCAMTGFAITSLLVRIPKQEEKEHVQ